MHTFALQVRPRGFEDRKKDGEQLHQVSSDVACCRLMVHHVQSVEGLQGTNKQYIKLYSLDLEGLKNVVSNEMQILFSCTYTYFKYTCSILYLI